MTAPPAAPLPLDEIPTEAEYYSVKVAALDDRGEAQLVVFTHDRPDAVAAVCRYVREQWKAEPGQIRFDPPAWWQVTPDQDSDEDGAWTSVVCAPDAPNAVPVFECGVDY